MGNQSCCCCRKPTNPPVQITEPPTSEPDTTSSRQTRKRSVVVGIHKFRGIDPKDLSFDKGDRMKVLEEEKEEWIKVENLSSRRIGYVPANYVALELTLESYDWYFGHTSRKEAEMLILGDENEPTGTFLVRVSENGRGYSLSVKDYDAERGYHVKHYKIERTNGGEYCLTHIQAFKNIPQLVLAYSTNSDTQDRLLSHATKKPEPTIAGMTSKYRDKWEINRSEIRILEKLGEGNYGEVFHGIWRDQCHVAIKTLREDSTLSKENFLKEAAIMKTFRHTKLVQLYGVCTLKEPIYIVQEYMGNGSLQKFLREDQGRTFKFEDLIFIAFQVASGMEHLELINYVHRDLAARNVLLGPGKSAKICDFGLARIRNKQGYCIEGGELPIKWTAPEALTKSLFTIKSDVWSYGVLLMELFTYGETPYKGVPYGVVVETVLAGHRMAKPTNFPLPDEIYENIILQCWQENPEKRPTFKYLAKYFGNLDITYKSCGYGNGNIKITHNVSNSYEQHLQPLKRR